MTVLTGMSGQGLVPVPGNGEPFSPARMVETDLAGPLLPVNCDGLHRRAWVLARLGTEPVGTCVVPLGTEGLTADGLAALLWRELREPVATRFAMAGLPPPRAMTGEGLEMDPAARDFMGRRPEVPARAPFISVVICTIGRPAKLTTCLRHLGRQVYPRFEVVVVDNAPASDATRAVVAACQDGIAPRYVTEPRTGLSRARNTGTAAASGEVIAFLDDDEEPDSYWLAGIARGFARGDGIGCVTGPVMPAVLDTPAQQLFEDLGGHSKGRAFVPAVFSRHGPQNPLFPLPPFGAGGNMAFRRDTLDRIGGFDVAMGSGTPARASEDTLALTLALLAGYRIAYEPAALVRHHHHGDLDSLGRQLRGYGVGLGAYYAALVRHRPDVIPGLLRLVPAAARYIRGARGTPGPAPRDLLAALARRQRYGMLAGPGAYLRSMREQARVATAGARRCA